VNLWRLTWIFTVLSLLGFGGGNAIIPQMHRDVVEHYHWITSQQFAQFYALGRLAPGPTTTMSALVGFAVAGFAGAVVAALAVFVPAGIVVAAVGRAWRRLHAHPFRDIFARGMAPVVIGLTWAGVLTIALGALDAPLTVGIALVVSAFTLFTKWNASAMILAAAIVGIVALR